MRIVVTGRKNYLFAGWNFACRENANWEISGNPAHRRQAGLGFQLRFQLSLFTSQVAALAIKL
jgi:hypothetical protein